MIEDAPELTLDLAAAEALGDGRPIEAYSWTEIERDLSAPWIISKRDSAIRGFGFWKAWQRGARVIVTLDDDCYPAGDGFLDAHLANLDRTPVWQSTVPGCESEGSPTGTPGRSRVAVSIGLWDTQP